MNDFKKFELERKKIFKSLKNNKKLQSLNKIYLDIILSLKYVYQFDWLGLPIIQFPQDIIAMQQIIWDKKPDTIIETGVARGGSLIFWSSMLELLHGPKKGNVVGIDIDIRKHNKKFKLL